MTIEIPTRPVARMPIWLRVLNWLADRDARYREAHKLRNMSTERLEDVGITREEANRAFYQRGSRRADQYTPEKLLAFRLR